MSSANPDSSANLPLDAHQRREVFARFGLAMYYAQCLERQLGLMLASMYNRQFLEFTPAARDELYNRELSKTLGRMTTDLKKTMEVPPTLTSRLTEAVRIRNSLAHNYFSERAAEILSLRGREKMILELQERADFLQTLDRDFTEIMDKWLNHLGVSEADVHREMSIFLQESDVDEDLL